MVNEKTIILHKFLTNRLKNLKIVKNYNITMYFILFILLTLINNSRNI